MSSKLNKLINILETEGLELNKDNLHEINLMDGFNLAFLRLIPSRHCTYDTEVIDDIDGYYFVLESHFKATQREWIVSDLKITGEIERKINIEFLFNNKKVKWSFDQHGSDYVSEDFLKKLHGWVSRTLTGRFVDLETGGQDIAFVYLPKKTASKVKQFLKKFIDIDMYVEQFRSKDIIPEEFYALRDDNSFDINSLDSYGETALTAAIKNENYMMTKEIIDFEFCDYLVKNRDGYTPLQIARQKKADEIIELLESNVTYQSENWEDIKWFYHSDIHDDNSFRMIELMDAINTNKSLKDIYLCSPVFYSVFFARSPSIELGHDTLNIRIIHKKLRKALDMAFDIEYSSSNGTENDFVLKSVTIDQALESVFSFYKVDTHFSNKWQ